MVINPHGEQCRAVKGVKGRKPLMDESDQIPQGGTWTHFNRGIGAAGFLAEEGIEMNLDGHDFGVRWRGEAPRPLCRETEG